MPALSPPQRRPWYSPVRLLQRLLIWLILAYLTLCGFLYFDQDAQIYPAALSGAVLTKDRALQRAAAEGLVPWAHPTAGASSPQGYVARNFDDPAPRGTIVVFHGNGGWAGDRSNYVQAFGQRGFRTFLYEYPGYGGRPGHPCEATLIPDARALIRELQARGLGPVYIWGESLGSGVAASVAADPKLPVHGLCLMMPWDTIAAVALYRFPWVPVRWLMHDTYDSIGNLSHFQHPICVIRGTEDTTIPPALSLNLFAHLPQPKLMIVKQGYGHGDWPDAPELPWWDQALNFLTAQPGQ